MITPKALANFSPGLERSDNPGDVEQEFCMNPERVRRVANPFTVFVGYVRLPPGLSLRSNPGAQISQRLRRNQFETR
jgi:hypothetical protein